MISDIRSFRFLWSAVQFNMFSFSREILEICMLSLPIEFCQITLEENEIIIITDRCPAISATEKWFHSSNSIGFFFRWEFYKFWVSLVKLVVWNSKEWIIFISKMFIMVYFWPRLTKLTEIFAKLSFGKKPGYLYFLIKGWGFLNGSPETCKCLM